MALLYRAELNPTKLELLNTWLPDRPWYQGPAVPDLRRVVSYRFDDPEGEVGIETLIVQDGDGPLHQVPLTYRGAPLDGHDPWLVGTSEHSVLGRRYVYDACGDPVYASVLAYTIVTGAGQAEEFLSDDGRLERREPAMSVRGSGAPGADAPRIDAVAGVDDGDPTLIRAGSLELAVVRILDRVREAGAPNLIGSWDGQPAPVLLAYAR